MKNIRTYAGFEEWSLEGERTVVYDGSMDGITSCLSITSEYVVVSLLNEYTRDGDWISYDQIPVVFIRIITMKKRKKKERNSSKTELSSKRG